jgi:hypothetical protein
MLFALTDKTSSSARKKQVTEIIGGYGRQQRCNGNCRVAVALRDFGRTPAHLSAIPPPRGGPGEGPLDLPFRVDYLDGERLLPVLVRRGP